MMPLLSNRWVAPILAMVMTLLVSSLKVYFYVDGVMRTYTQSYYVDNSDHYVYWTFHTREIQELVDALDGKKMELDKRSDEMEAFQTRLENERKELLEMRSQVEAIQDGLSSTIVQSKEGEMQNLKNLASTYAAMNADAVVGVLNEMDDNTVVKILALMKSDTVAPIFEAMEKVPNQGTQMSERIARLSEKLRLYKQAQPAK